MNFVTQVLKGTISDTRMKPGAGSPQAGAPRRVAAPGTHTPVCRPQAQGPAEISFQQYPVPPDGNVSSRMHPSSLLIHKLPHVKKVLKIRVSIALCFQSQASPSFFVHPKLIRVARGVRRTILALDGRAPRPWTLWPLPPALKSRTLTRSTSMRSPTPNICRADVRPSSTICVVCIFTTSAILEEHNLLWLP